MRRLKEQLGEVALVPPGFEAFVLNAELRASILFQPCQSDMAQHRQVLAGCGIAYPRLILAKGDIKAPMQHILNAPMTAGGPCEVADIGADAADVETRLRGDLAVDLAARLDHADHVHRLPYPGGTFDRALMFDVVEHLFPWELHASLSDIYRVLKPGGTEIPGIGKVTLDGFVIKADAILDINKDNAASLGF